MERGADLVEEDFAILATQILRRSIPNLVQNLATSNTWLRVDPGKGLVVVPRFEIILLLFSELQR